MLNNVYYYTLTFFKPLWYRDKNLEKVTVVFMCVIKV